MKASVSQLNALAGWWRRPSGTLLHVSRYVSASGRRYPRESVFVSMHKADGTGICHGTASAAEARCVIDNLHYVKVGEEGALLAEVLAS